MAPRYLYKEKTVMKCPFCKEDSQVRDSRPSDSGAIVKRRRFCTKCDAKFTTFEMVENKELFVKKKSGARRPFDINKITKSISIAMRKRPIEKENIIEISEKIRADILKNYDNDLPSSIIGDLILSRLAQIDDVAYVRYASVYKDFDSISDFTKFISEFKK